MKALVLGASGGIGSVVMECLTLRGHEVVGQRYQRAASKCDYADLQYESEIIALVDAAAPEVLVHCAGIDIGGMSWKMSADDFDEVLAVNARSVWLAAKHAIPAMRSRHFGRLIWRLIVTR